MKRTRCGRGNRTIGGAFVQFGCHTGRCVPSTFVYRLNYVRHLSRSSDEGRRLNARAAREHSAGTWRLIGASLIEQEPNAEGLFVHISRTLRLKCEHKKNACCCCRLHEFSSQLRRPERDGCIYSQYSASSRLRVENV